MAGTSPAKTPDETYIFSRQPQMPALSLLFAGFLCGGIKRAHCRSRPGAERMVAQISPRELPDDRLPDKSRRPVSPPSRWFLRPFHEARPARRRDDGRIRLTDAGYHGKARNMALYEHVFLARQDVTAQQVEEMTTRYKALI